MPRKIYSFHFLPLCVFEIGLWKKKSISFLSTMSCQPSWVFNCLCQITISPECFIMSCYDTMYFLHAFVPRPLDPKKYATIDSGYPYKRSVTMGALLWNIMLLCLMLEKKYNLPKPINPFISCVCPILEFYLWVIIAPRDTYAYNMVSFHVLLYSTIHP